jgi:hypothetical protein
MNTRETNAAAAARMGHKQMSKKEGLLHALKGMGQIDIDAEAYALIKNDLGPDIVVTERAGGKYYYLTQEEK